MKPDADNPIFLTGLMGVGKSSVGAQLAKNLAWSFKDTDEVIVENAQMPIPQIFAEKGEIFFRELENTAIRQVTKLKHVVVALGGGALLDSSNLQTIEAAGVLVFLRASIASLQERLQATKDSRPLLAGLNSQEQSTKLHELLEARLPSYQRATLTIDTDGLQPAEIAQKIQEQLFARKGTRNARQ